MTEFEILTVLLALAGMGIGLTRFNPLLASPRSSMVVIAVLSMIGASLILLLIVGASTVQPPSGIAGG